jgi:plastocyanin
MRASRRAVGIAGLTCAALALPAVAEAKTKVVAMGLPSAKVVKQFSKQGGDVNDFFPHGTTIHVGDKVRFVPTGFHTVDLPPKSGGILPFFEPTGQPVTGVNDAAGAPFWFNGQSALALNPALASGSFGKRVNYTGAKRVETGAPLGPAKPMVVRFKRAGRYTYFCDIHPGMKGTVTVRPHGKRIPTAKQDAKRLKRQVKRDLKIAKNLTRTRPPAATVDVGSAGPHGVEAFAMFPRTLHANVGQTITFRMTKGSFEDHTATFGPGNPNDPSTFLGQLAASFASPVLDPRAAYPSERPGDSPASYSPALHGDGFWNSGLIDRASATPLPASNSVTFSAPGTYTYYCLIHPFMVGTVQVG